MSERPKNDFNKQKIEEIVSQCYIIGNSNAELGLTVQAVTYEIIQNLQLPRFHATA